MSQFWPLVDFVVVVFVVEFFVDWVKHGFILKFNELSSEVYREYILSLAHDMVKTKQDIVGSLSSYIVVQRFHSLGSIGLYGSTEPSIRFYSVTVCVYRVWRSFSNSQY